jgi:putative transposase
MITIMSALLSVLSFHFRRRATLELELVALRHPAGRAAAAAARRPASDLRNRPTALDVALPDWPRTLNAMVLVKPATVIQWHRKGFRLCWRWRSRSRSVGRPEVSSETRDLIRQMSMANPLWGAPQIHGELLKLGIEVSQATVGRYLPWRPKVPSPTWRTFLQNHMTDIVAVDMFVVATATFRLFYP